MNTVLFVSATIGFSENLFLVFCFVGDLHGLYNYDNQKCLGTRDLTVVLYSNCDNS